MTTKNLKLGERSESLFSRYIDTLRSGVVVLDHDYRIVHSNRFLQTWVKRPAAELTGQHCYRLFHGRESPCEDCPATRAEQTGEPASVTHTGHDAAGGETFAALTIFPILDEDGRAEYFLESVTDTTERTLAEREKNALIEALSSSEARSRTVVEQSSDAIFMLDLDGRVVWSNGRFAAFGPTCAQVGVSFVDCLEEADRGRAQDALARALAGTPQSWQARLRVADGTHARLHLNTSARLDGSSVAGTLTFAQDVTARDRAEAALLESEAQLRQAQKMEAVGRLAGGVAHDFNNLLTIILASSEQLKLDLGQHKPADAEDVDQIYAAGERARDLTRQLLAFARKQVISLVSLDVNAVVRGSERLLRRVLGEDVILRVELAETVWPTFGDAGQVEQVLMNLAVNARDAMPEGGTLTLRTANRAECDTPAADPAHRDRRWVRLIVQDTGTGISPDVKAHMFEPFFTTKGPGMGTGLGLSTVYGIVNQSGGHIHVHSELGQGTRFEICLPRGSESAGQATPSEPIRQMRGTETILIVEDDPQVHTVTVRSLRRAGYVVFEASDGVEALELLGRQEVRIDLVVTDVVMPRMGGRALADELRRRDPSLPILFVSGYVSDSADQRGVLAADVEFLRKPFAASTLLGRVRAILDARKHPSMTPPREGIH